MKSQYKIDAEKAPGLECSPDRRLDSPIARAKYSIVHRGPCRKKLKEQNPKPEVVKFGRVLHFYKVA